MQPLYHTVQLHLNTPQNIQDSSLANILGNLEN